MALFQKLQRTVCKLTRPVVQKANTTELAQSEEDEETCDYAVALQNCLIGLANEVYGVADPRDISGRVLRQACDFYDADWCGLFDVDRMLKLLVPFWWYNRTTGGMTKTKLDESGVYGDFTRWMDALNTNTPIYVDDIEKIKKSNPEEYAIYSKQEVRSILAVPYHKREKGFLLLRNPKRYGDKPEMLQIMANILVAEINEQKHLDRMKAEGESMDTSAEIVINLFGGLEIITSKGTLSEAEIKSPLACIKALGDYLFEHNYEKKYKIYLGEYQRTYKKIKIFNKTHRIYNKLSSVCIFLRAKYVFYAFNTLPIYPAKDQIVFQMWHGMPLKTIFNYGKENYNQIKYDYFSFILATSQFFKTIMSEAVPCSIDKVIVCGQPKTDGLFKDTNMIKKNNCKLIFWAPTFRQAKYWDQQDAKLESILPLISDEDLEALNEYLKNNNVIIVSKLHPMENCDEDLCIEYSNLFIYSHRSFNKRDLDLYPVLGQTDALITDYSSVYMDYLLLDKPMAFIVDNISEYSVNRGFVFENPQKYMTGPCLKNKEELYEFIRNIADGYYFNEYNRTEVNELFNDYEKTESNCKALLKLLGIE